MKTAATLASMALVFSLSLTACSDDSGGGDVPSDIGDAGGSSESSSSSSSSNDAGATGIGGQSQKGPFQPGGTSLARPLEADGSPGSGEITGDIDSNGEYQLGGIDWTGPTEVVMEGTFYNEVSGGFSSGTRTLSAVTDYDEGEALSVNVNIFTDFTAERVKTLMAAGAAFSEALAQARDEIRTVFGLSSNPADLNLLETIEDVESDSANLLMFSAAGLEAGVDQAGLDEMAADFADDGEINGAGTDEYAAIESRADSDLLSTARGNLQSQYSTTPPDISGPGDIAWQLSACASAKLTEPRVFCGEEVFQGIKVDDEDEPILYYPPNDAFYAFSLVGDAATGSLSGWRLYYGGSWGGVDYGRSDDSSPYEATTELKLSAEQQYAMHVFLTDSTDPGDGFTLRGWQVNEGAAYSPIELIVGRSHSGRVGQLFLNGTTGGPATSWYRFRSTGGQYRIRVSGYSADSGSGGLQIDVYKGIVDDQTSIADLGDLTLVDEADSSGSGSNEVVTDELDADWPYFVLITNEFTDSRRTSFRPATGWTEFDISITEAE